MSDCLVSNCFISDCLVCDCLVSDCLIGDPAPEYRLREELADGLRDAAALVGPWPYTLNLKP